MVVIIIHTSTFQIILLTLELYSWDSQALNIILTFPSLESSQNQTIKNIYQILHQEQLFWQEIFKVDRAISYGEAIYIVGNVKELGQWNIDKAVRMQCYEKQHWLIEIDLPLNTQIQFRYFIDRYDRSNQQNSQLTWIKFYEKSENHKLYMTNSMLKVQNQLKNKLKIMSFNIRFQNSKDTNEFSWQNRKKNCRDLIIQNHPHVLGVQQAKKQQREYLSKQLNHFYQYVGRARDLKQGQQVGIFFDHNRFVLEHYEDIWISQSKQPGSIGFGARLPRVFTAVILQDINYSPKCIQFIRQYSKSTKQQSISKISSTLQQTRQFIMIVNVHLDHQSLLSKTKGIQMIKRHMNKKKKMYGSQLTDFFLIGDFNEPQKSQIFNHLKPKQQFNIQESQISLISIRQDLNLNGKQHMCDMNYTFNGFAHNIYDQINDKKTIDHLFFRNGSLKQIKYKAQKFKVLRENVKEVKNEKSQFNNIISDHFPIIGIFEHI